MMHGPINTIITYIFLCGCILTLVIHITEVRTLSAILTHAEDRFLCFWRFMWKGRYLPVDLVVTWQVLSIILQWLAWGQRCCALWLCNDTAGTTKTQNIYQPLFLVCTAHVSFITLIGMCRPSALISAAPPARALYLGAAQCHVICDTCIPKE